MLTSTVSRRRARTAFVGLAGLAVTAVLVTTAHAAGAAKLGGTTQAASPVTGGIKVYEAKLTGLSIALGPQSNPTTVATEAVPAGTYLVTAFIGVGTQPGSFIVCALSNVTNGNDGVFGVFTNQWTLGAQENVRESETVQVSLGQSIHLTCDDNNGRSGDVVGEAVLDAVPVSALH